MPGCIYTDFWFFRAEFSIFTRALTKETYETSQDLQSYPEAAREH
jgi:hypothetical protein